MKGRIRKKIYLLVLLMIPVIIFISGVATSDNVTLFTISRSLDDDLLNYDLNFDESGAVDVSNPIHPYWVRNTQGGIQKELNPMQRKFAYGLKYSLKEEGLYKFRIVSYKKQDFYLKKSPKGKYFVFVLIDDKFVVLKNLHIKVVKNGTIFNPPKVKYIDISWYSLLSKKEGVKRIDPNE